MRRTLSHIATALSLVLFAASCAVWVRSHRRQGLFTFPLTPAADAHVFWARGTVGCTVPRSRVATPDGGGRVTWSESPGPVDLYRYWVTLRGVRLHAGGFAATAGAATATPGVLVPCWSVALTSLALPAATAVRAARRRTARAGGATPCACGYDLRATPDRCPECGAVPNRATGIA